MSDPTKKSIVINKSFLSGGDNLNSSNIQKKSKKNTRNLSDEIIKPNKLKKMLLETGDAELHHYVGRGKPNLFMKNLMKVRECIRKYDNVYDLKEMSKFSTEIVTKVLND